MGVPYKLYYRLGFHPWEDLTEHPHFRSRCRAGSPGSGRPVRAGVGVVVEDQHGPVIDRQAADRRLELVPLDDRVEPAGLRRLVGRQDPEVRRPWRARRPSA